MPPAAETTGGLASLRHAIIVVLASSSRLLTGPQLVRLVGGWSSGADATPAYGRLAAAVRALVLDGRIGLGTRLPAERELAVRLGVSRTTVSAAYDVLREEGVLESRGRAGSWTTLPRGGVGSHRAWTGPPRPSDRVIDLALASPAAPAEALAEAVRAAAARLPAYLGDHGYDPFGIAPLRAAVARRYAERGLPTTADQILVTSGAQAALDLLLRHLVSARDAVLVEAPSYPNALEAIRRTGARLVPVGLGDEGWDRELLEAAVRQTVPRAIYTVPDFHNPTGLRMAPATRGALVAAARRAGALVIADETTVDLALDHEALVEPLACHDSDGRVLTLGSTSKAIWGGLRVGWLRAPAPLVARLAALRATVDMAAPVVEQLVVVELLEDVEQLLVERRALLRARRDALVAAVRERLPAWQVTPPPGGLSLWARLDRPDSTALSRVAERHGVRLVPGPRFGVDGTFEHRLRLPFALPEPDLVEAVDRLAAADAIVRAGGDRSGRLGQVA